MNHPASGLKVDVIVPAITEFTQSERARIKLITSEGEYSVWFGSPEDVLLNKLVYFKLGGGESQKQLRDSGGMLKLLACRMAALLAGVSQSRLGGTSHKPPYADRTQHSNYHCDGVGGFRV